MPLYSHTCSYIHFTVCTHLFLIMTTLSNLTFMKNTKVNFTNPSLYGENNVFLCLNVCQECFYYVHLNFSLAEETSLFTRCLKQHENLQLCKWIII